jgi:hypothetical protein
VEGYLEDCEEDRGVFVVEGQPDWVSLDPTTFSLIISPPSLVSATGSFPFTISDSTTKWPIYL